MVISVLRMQHFEMGRWIQLKKEGKHVGKIGFTLSELRDWSLGYRMPRTSSELGALTGFTACVRSGRYGQGKQVSIGTFSGALLSVATTVDLAYDGNTTKAQGEKYWYQDWHK